MINNKRALTLTTIAMLSLSSATSQIPVLDANSNCSGYFYEDINAAFIDCYDKDGVLTDRNEYFY